MEKFSIASSFRAPQQLWTGRFSGSSVSSRPGTTRGTGPGPRCTLQRPPCGQPPAELSSCAVLRVGPCQGVPGLRGALSRHGPFRFGPSVLSLPFLALPAVVLAWWPLGPFQPPSYHALPLRDFPGTGPSPEPAGPPRGSDGSPPRKPRLLAQGILPGSQK